MLTDSLQRIRALSCSESFIVQAPAGSGKTELLTQRFLKLLTSVENPEQIVALTFTKKAAFEMRSRIIQALNKAKLREDVSPLAYEALDLSQKNEWHLIENPHRLRIYTIDSFCSQLAKSLPVTSGMGGMPDIEENPGYLYKKAVENYLSSIEQEGEWVEGLCLILQHFHNRYEVIEKLFMAMLARRDQWLQLVMNGRRNPEKFKAVIQDSLLSIHEEAFAHLNRLLSEELKQKWMQLASFGASQLFAEKKSHELISCLNMTDFPDNTYENLAIFSGLLSLVFTSTQTIRKKIDKNSGFPSTIPEMKKLFSEFISEIENDQSLVEQLKIIPHLPAIELDPAEWKLLAALWESLPILVAHLQLMFKQYNKVDFTEVNLKALEALGEEDNPTDLALILDYQIKHLLVDEFQDTSSIQYQLFEKIVSGWQANDGRTLFVVGDPMQSIYRFRGAEVGLYLKLQQHGFGHVLPINLTLTSNFRSDKSIVDWVNQSFSPIFSKENDMVLGKIAYSASSATQSLTPNGVYCYAFLSVQLEAQFIIKKIQEIKLSESKPDISIAILVRARDHAQAIFHELKAQNIHYQAIDMVSLNHSQLITDLLMLTRVVMLADSRLAWFSLFRSPICGLSLSDLWLLTQNTDEAILPVNFDLSLLSPEGQVRASKIIQILSYWQNNQYRLPLHQAIRHLWMSLGFDLFYEDEINASAYFELLLKWEEGNQFGDFEVLEEKINSLYQASSGSTTDSAVQIMTIHKAKGLEFDYVFIPGLQHATIKEDQPLVIYHEIPYRFHVDWLIAPKYTASKRSRLYDYIHSQLQQKAVYETQRLLYVAATRAKKQLIWSYYKPVEKVNAPKDSFLAMLDPFLDPISLSPESDKPDNTDKSDKNDLNADNYSPMQIRVSTQTALPWQAVEEKFVMNPDLTEDNPLNRPLFQPYEKLSIMGSYLHRLFASWQSVDLLNLEAHQHNLLAMGLFQTDVNYASTLITKMIQQCKQDNQFNWIMDSAHQAIQNEFALNFIRNNKLQTRILDKFFIDKNNSLAWIIDFKLTLETPNPSEHFAQLAEYAKLINNLGILGGKPLRFGLYYPYQSYWWEQESICA